MTEVLDAARRAGSSFYWAMRLLPRERREAMFALYAYCRALDDIADGDAAEAVKRDQLQAWRRELDALFDGRPSHPVACALVGPVHRYDLERAPLQALIDGMEMDVAGGMVAPPLAELRLYCARVAGAVGLLSVRVFGCRGADRFALALGEALQLTNILRDLGEDAALGRLYLPRELLAEAGINDHDPARVLAHPALPRVCEQMADMAETLYAEAQALAAPHARALRPALAMMGAYRTLLDRLRRRGWQAGQARLSLSRWEMLWTALRAMVRA